MKLIKTTVTHKFGNMIGGLARTLEGLTLFLSLGNVRTDLTLKWNTFRKENNIFYDAKMF